MDSNNSNNDGLRIVAVNFRQELNEMLVTLGTGIVLHLLLSDYPILENASMEQLRQCTLIGDGAGVHWPTLNEDLSLRGFLQGAAISLEQYNTEIEEGMKQIDAGEFYTNDQVKEMAEGWLKGK